MSKCKSKDNIDDLLEGSFKERNLNLMCKNIRLAFATATDLWSTRQLLNNNHNESRSCTNAYSFIWDKVFLNDDRSIFKRTNCYSNTTKQFCE
ncbi:hypothetical protein BDF21DRAFT_433470 [Thamnidium elegans]|nr:hypothetical protein BDF21DRAFT_433470 [Thamnidium elegans]